MGYDIVTLETQNHGQDWPLIVTAVPCPTCGAEKGEMCHALAAANPMLNSGTQRIDWHSARKQNAAAAWYTRDQSAAQPPEAPPVPESSEGAVAQADGAPQSVTSQDGIGEGEVGGSSPPSTQPIEDAAPKAEAKGKKKGAPPPPPPPPSK